MSLKTQIQTLAVLERARAALRELRDGERSIMADLPHLQLAPSGYGCALDVCVTVDMPGALRGVERTYVTGFLFSGRGGDLFRLTAAEAATLGRWLTELAPQVVEANT